MSTNRNHRNKFGDKPSHKPNSKACPSLRVVNSYVARDPLTASRGLVSDVYHATPERAPSVARNRQKRARTYLETQTKAVNS